MRLIVKLSKKLLVSVLFLFGAVVCSYAAGPSTDVNVYIVHKQTAKPVVGAVVGFPDYGIWGVSDANGYSLLKDVPRGKGKIMAQMVGMVTLEKEIEVKGKSDTVRVEMEENSFRLDKVEVVAKSNAAGASTSSTIPVRP